MTDKNVWFFPDKARADPYDDNKDGLIKYLIENMFLKTNEMFAYKGLPDTIPKEILELQLQRIGYSCIFKHNGELYASYGGLGGKLNYNYLPTICTVANPYLELSKMFTIGKDCVVGRNDALYIGLEINHRLYATNMVENLLTTRTVLINMRADMAFEAPNQDIYDAIEKFYDGLMKGETHAILAKNDFFNNLKTLEHNNGDSGRKITQLIENLQYNRASWWNEMGVQSNYNMKRESINSNESQLNDAMLKPFPDHMLAMRQKMCEEVNAMFGTNWSVDFSSVWKEIRKTDEQNLEEDNQENTEHSVNEESEDKDNENIDPLES